jgi:Cu/Zn superoxide dismutase
MIDPKVDEKAILASVESGFRAIKIKLGESDLEVDSDQPAPLGGGGARIACGVVK